MPEPSAAAVRAGPGGRGRAERLHVGVVLPAPGDGGVGKTMFALAEALAERGHRIDLLLLRQYGRRAEYPAGARLFVVRGLRRPRQVAPALEGRRPAAAYRPGPLAAAREWLALRVRHPEMRVPAKAARDAVAVADYARAERPAALLSGGAAANAAALLGARAARTPVAVTIHAAVAEGYDAATRARARALYPEARAAVGVSQGVAGQAAELLGLDPRRVHAIYNGVRAADVRRRSAEAAAHRWFSGGGPPVVLSVGRFAPQKDHATLVEAFARVRRRRAARLVVMGAGAARDRAALRAAARRRGVGEDVDAVDFDANPFRYMRRAAAFALSSRWEGLPGVLLEALACGTPAVSTDAPFGPAEILGGGRWGALVPVGDAGALAAAIGGALSGDRPAAAELRARAAEFGVDRMADAYERLLVDMATAESVNSDVDGPRRRPADRSRPGRRIVRDETRSTEAA